MLVVHNLRHVCTFFIILPYFFLLLGIMIPINEFECFLRAFKPPSRIKANQLPTKKPALPKIPLNQPQQPPPTVHQQKRFPHAMCIQKPRVTQRIHGFVLKVQDDFCLLSQFGESIGGLKQIQAFTKALKGGETASFLQQTTQVRKTHDAMGNLVISPVWLCPVIKYNDQVKGFPDFPNFQPKRI